PHGSCVPSKVSWVTSNEPASTTLLLLMAGSPFCRPTIGRRIREDSRRIGEVCTVEHIADVGLACGRRPLGRHGNSAPDAAWFRLPGSSHRLPCAAARSAVLSHASSQVSSSDNCPKSESRCAGSSRSLGQRCLILRYVNRTSEHSCAVTPGSSAVSACSTLSNAPFTSSIANSYGVKVSSRKCSSLYHAAGYLSGISS